MEFTPSRASVSPAAGAVPPFPPAGGDWNFSGFSSFARAGFSELSTSAEPILGAGEVLWG